MTNKKTNTPYEIPKHIQTKEFGQKQYKKWIDGKARSHRIRDNARWGTNYTNVDYRNAIHAAVVKNHKIDPYTGDPLDWTLVQKFDSNAAKKGGAKYKEKFAFMPSLDHKDIFSKKLDFEIVCWRTNDAKSDMTAVQFRELCKKVVAFKNK
jgi:hypothetical protein